MLKVHLSNGITMVLNEDHVQEAIALWLGENTSFLIEESADFEMEFEGIEPAEAEPVQDTEPEASGETPKKRRKRRTKEQIEADNAKKEAQETETIAEEKPELETPVKEEPVKDLLQEVIDEIPAEEVSEEAVLEEVVAEAMADESILEPKPKGDDVLDLTASIFS